MPVASSRPAAARPRVLYLAPDLSDPAARRRVRMLKAGGAEVLLAGFRRSGHPVPTVEGVDAFDLGPTQDLKLLKRVLAILGALARLPVLARAAGQVDCILARNLETLVIGALLQATARRSARLVYEVLDIHRLMLGEGLASRLLRLLERSLARSVSRLVVSSPAFVEAYFRRRWKATPPVSLIENKVLDLDASPLRRAPGALGPPWRVGWFGMLRCQRSLDILCRLAQASEGRLEVVLRGRPTLELFSDFQGQVAGCRGVEYLGPYSEADLPGMYADVHLAWAIDFYEEGQNSAWLLPNRLYESLYMGCVPIALQDNQTGRWLQRRAAGLLVADVEEELASYVTSLTEDRYLEMQRARAAVPLNDLVCDRSECEAFVSALVT